PMAAIRAGIPRAVQALGREGRADAANAILTTDAYPKMAAAQLEVGGVLVTIGGMAKGAGMIHPNMATTLCVLTTDAAIPGPQLRQALRKAADASLNRTARSGDTRPNDTLVPLPNGPT